MSWRLPTINELQAMYDRDNNKRIEGFLKTSYWSSTILDNNVNVWIVNFCNGNSGYSHKQSNYNICCVRDNEDGGLDLTFSLKKMNWTQAMAYTENLNVKDSDIVKMELRGLVYRSVRKWRLPTISELQAMFNKELGEGVKGFCTKSSYWSSTKHTMYSNIYWIMYFEDGATRADYGRTELFVRCVSSTEDGLELAPASEDRYSFPEALEYAETLMVPEEEIIKLKLNGLFYEEQGE
jgi:phage baseplate assembly protein gpV